MPRSAPTPHHAPRSSPLCALMLRAFVLRLAALGALVGCGTTGAARESVTPEPPRGRAEASEPPEHAEAATTEAPPIEAEVESDVARSGDSAAWYASLRDERARRIADAEHATAIATARWLNEGALLGFTASPTAYASWDAASGTVCAQQADAPSICASHAGVTDVRIRRLRDPDTHAWSASYCLEWRRERAHFSGRWSPGGEGTEGACPDGMSDAPALARAFAAPGAPSPFLEARLPHDVLLVPVRGRDAVALASHDMLCVREERWRCVGTGPLGEGSSPARWIALHAFRPGVWILSRHRTEGSSDWSDGEDAMLAVSFAPGGVTVLGRFLLGVQYESREDGSGPFDRWGVVHEAEVRGACIEVGAPTRTGRARRGRLPLAPDTLDDGERLQGDIDDESVRLDRRGAWVLRDDGFTRVDRCPSTLDIAGDAESLCFASALDGLHVECPQFDLRIACDELVEEIELTDAPGLERVMGCRNYCALPYRAAYVIVAQGEPIWGVYAGDDSACATWSTREEAGAHLVTVVASGEEGEGEFVYAWRDGRVTPRFRVLHPGRR